jgi:DNA-binding response OmpR family regulator
VKLTLTISENRLIQTFLEQKNVVISHRDLVHKALGYDIKDWEAPEILRPLISRLRHKLSTFPGMAERIICIRGSGYLFEDE